MSDLVEFLLAQIAKDEEVARQADAPGDVGGYRVEPTDRADYLALTVGPGYVLAECEAKRRVVNRARAWLDEPAATPTEVIAHDLLGHVVRCLALPYADRPDWREEWRP